jgi:hypothetical protein
MPEFNWRTLQLQVSCGPSGFEGAKAESGGNPCRRSMMSSHLSNRGRTRPRRAPVSINLAIALVHAREMDDVPSFPCSILWLNCERGFLRALPSWSLGGRRIVSLTL